MNPKKKKTSIRESLRHGNLIPSRWNDDAEDHALFHPCDQMSLPMKLTAGRRKVRSAISLYPRLDLLDRDSPDT